MQANRFIGDFLSHLTEVILLYRFEGQLPLVSTPDSIFKVTSQKYTKHLDEIRRSTREQSQMIIRLDFFLVTGARRRRSLVEQFQFQTMLTSAPPPSSSISSAQQQQQRFDDELVTLERSVLTLLVSSPLTALAARTAQRQAQLEYEISYNNLQGALLSLNTIKADSGFLMLYGCIHEVEALLPPPLPPSSPARGAPNAVSGAATSSSLHQAQNGRASEEGSGIIAAGQDLSADGTAGGTAPSPLSHGGSITNAAVKRRARFASEDIGSNLTTRDSQDSSDKDRKQSFPDGVITNRARCGSINIVSIYSEKDDITIISTPDDGVVQRIHEEEGQMFELIGLDDDCGGGQAHDAQERQDDADDDGATQGNARRKRTHDEIKREPVVCDEMDEYQLELYDAPGCGGGGAGGGGAGSGIAGNMHANKKHNSDSQDLIVLDAGCGNACDALRAILHRVENQIAHERKAGASPKASAGSTAHKHAPKGLFNEFEDVENFYKAFVAQNVV